MEAFEFRLRPRILYKPGLAREIGREIAQLGCSKAVIITDSGIVQAKLLNPVLQGLDDAVGVAATFTEVPPNSSVQAVEAAAALIRESEADLLIAVGGGSALDTAKLARVLLALGGTLQEYEDQYSIEQPLTPLIAIPTTAGTGSEVSPFAVIRDVSQQRKLSFGGPFLAPDLAILDPLLTITLPPHLTAATGIDALTHAIEAYVSKNANPMSDALALGAIDIISNHLRQATFQGDDLQARSQMLIASCMAGIAYSSAYVGIVHAVAHAIGGRYPVQHGLANAIVLPHGMRYNSVTFSDRFAQVSRYLGVNIGGRSQPEVIEDGIAAVETLIRDLELPTQLGKVDLPYEALEDIARAALEDKAIETNPRSATIEDVRDLVEAAW